MRMAPLLSTHGQNEARQVQAHGHRRTLPHRLSHGTFGGGNVDQAAPTLLARAPEVSASIGAAVGRGADWVLALPADVARVADPEWPRAGWTSSRPAQTLPQACRYVWPSTLSASCPFAWKPLACTHYQRMPSHAAFIRLGSGKKLLQKNKYVCKRIKIIYICEHGRGQPQLGRADAIRPLQCASRKPLVERWGQVVDGFTTRRRNAHAATSLVESHSAAPVVLGDRRAASDTTCRGVFALRVSMADLKCLCDAETLAGQQMAARILSLAGWGPRQLVLCMLRSRVLT